MTDYPRRTVSEIEASLSAMREWIEEVQEAIVEAQKELVSSMDTEHYEEVL